MNVLLWAKACYQQLSAGGKYPHEDCGEAEDASDLEDAGLHDTVPQIETWMLDHSDDPISGTMIDWNIAVMAALGLKSHYVKGDTFVFTQQALTNNHRCRVLVRVNGYGVVDAGAIPHFVTVRGYVDQVYYIRNPLGGFQTVPKRQFEDASEGEGIEIDHDYGQATGERTVFTDDEINKRFDDMGKAINAVKGDAASGIISASFQAILGREPSDTELDDWNNKVTSGSTSILGAVHSLADGVQTFRDALGRIGQQHNPGGG